MTWSLVPASPAQAAALSAIHHEAFPPAEAWGPDAIGLQLALPGVFGFAAIEGGLILARVAADEAEVLTLAVLPGLWRQGLGGALMSSAMVEARRRQAFTMVLEVSVTNNSALRLYSRFGFSPVGRRRGYYSDGSDALVLRAYL